MGTIPWGRGRPLPFVEGNPRALTKLVAEPDYLVQDHHRHGVQSIGDVDGGRALRSEVFEHAFSASASATERIIQTVRLSFVAPRRVPCALRLRVLLHCPSLAFRGSRSACGHRPLGAQLPLSLWKLAHR